MIMKNGNDKLAAVISSRVLEFSVLVVAAEMVCSCSRRTRLQVVYHDSKCNAENLKLVGLMLNTKEMHGLFCF